MCAWAGAFRHPVRIPLRLSRPPPTPCRAEPFFQEPIPRTRPRPPRYRPGSGTSPAPGTADPGDHSTPAAAPLRIYPARSAGPGFRVSPSVRIPGNCACVRPPHRMPPPTRTANRIIGRTLRSPLPPTARTYDVPPGPNPVPPVVTPSGRRPTHTTSRPVLIPSGHCPCHLLALPPTHTAPGPDPAPLRPILLFPSLRSLFIPPLFPAFSSARFPFRKYFP